MHCDVQQQIVEILRIQFIVIVDVHHQDQPAVDGRILVENHVLFAHSCSRNIQ